MPNIIDILGDKLVNKQGEPVDINCLGGNKSVVGLYFSAHWCQPCRSFTPELVTFYNKVKQSESGKCFEIVFVSSDKTAEEFEGYYGEMPWLALPFAERDRKVRY